MSSNQSIRSIFLADAADSIAAIEGGVQLCTREFSCVLHAACDEVRTFQVNVSKNLSLRLRRKLKLGSYLRYHPSTYRVQLAEVIHQLDCTHVFINRSELIRFAPLIRDIKSDIKIILMSHGNQTGDDLFEVADARGFYAGGLRRLVGKVAIGADLVTESEFRRKWLDGVCVMSREEEALEQWLGAKWTFFIPRVVNCNPLSCASVMNRVGFVGTLSHTPNRIALEMIFQLIAKKWHGKLPEIRLVGGPEPIGRQFASDFSFVSYLGALSDSDLRSEAGSWSLFLNPIFWLSRGASMKLGMALSWGLPCLSTTFGSRGYELPSGTVFEVDSNVSIFIEGLSLLLRDREKLVDLREKISLNRSSFPTNDSIGSGLRKRLIALSQ